jgi:hypothetical protein
VRAQVVHTVTLAIAAVRWCCHAVAQRVWWLADKFLRSSRATALAQVTPTILVVVMVLYKDGIYGLVTNATNLIDAAGVPYLAIREARRKRGISQPSPPQALASPAKKDGSTSGPPQSSEEPPACERRAVATASGLKDRYDSLGTPCAACGCGPDYCGPCARDQPLHGL